MRSAVACREQPLRAGHGFYLSLYDDEIDSRASIFWQRLQAADAQWAHAPLELTDAALFVSGGDVVVVRGASATFPLYWCNDNGRITITTALPVLEDEPLSAKGLVASVAAAALHGSYEPNAFVETPLARWHRVRRASWLRFRDAHCVGEGILQPTWQPKCDSATRLPSAYGRRLMPMPVHSQPSTGLCLRSPVDSTVHLLPLFVAETRCGVCR